MSKRILAAAAAAMVFAGAAPTAAQTLAERVAVVREGAVRFSFAARPGVCGNGQAVYTGRESEHWEATCEPGPVRVVLTLRDGRVAGVRSYVGGRWREASPAPDLGPIPAPEAAEFLLALGHKDAIFPATLADGFTAWPRLLELARDEAFPREIRRSAAFWLGQEAAEAATRGLQSIAEDEATDRAVRKQAIFALSQRPRGEGVPALLRVARTNRDPELRKQAIFWLSQSDDPRAIAFFEEVLLARRP